MDQRYDVKRERKNSHPSEKKQGQVAMEFMIIVGFLILIFMAFILIAVNRSIEISREKETYLAEDMAVRLQKEFITASKVDNGYNRSFVLPLSLQGEPYNVTIEPEYVTVSTHRQDATKRIPPVNSSTDIIIAGTRIWVLKENSTVFVLI